MKSLMHHEYVSIGSQNSTHRIILLHGWGADADDLLPIGEEIIHDASHPFEIISLRAPNIRSDSIGRQWYSLFPPDWSEAEIAADQLLDTLIEFGKKQIPLKKTILLGFSQGAAMALDVGLRIDLGLLISCSGYPHPKWIPTKNNPTLISHGKNDEVVPLSASKKILRMLESQSNSDFNFYEFDCAHSIHYEFINIIKSKIEEIF
tara:strand:- start:506 stop:1120 length:615 start_codon:yes stop_codon:yes gene_type:complete